MVDTGVGVPSALSLAGDQPMRHSIATALICAGLAGCSATGTTSRLLARPPESDVNAIVIVHVDKNGLVFFDSGSASVEPARRGATWTGWSQPTGSVALDRVDIIGHTDRTGSATSNLSLSLRRAEAVRDALVARGVPESLVHLCVASAKAIRSCRPRMEWPSRRTASLKSIRGDGRGPVARAPVLRGCQAFFDGATPRLEVPAGDFEGFSFFGFLASLFDRI